MINYLIGIDEAGRGPLAGPVSVGAVLMPKRFAWKLLDGVRDSKQLSEAQREAWYARLEDFTEEFDVRFAVSFSSAPVIDRRGISKAVALGVSRALARLDVNPRECEVRLDGSLYAPDVFEKQTTIIRGDQTEPIISLASIAAKVRRDRYMKRMAARFPEYGFEVHKGYGTPSHQQAIRAFGLSDLHREGFCKNILAKG